MKNFKKNWEIRHNWQLIFPILGLLVLIYSAFKLSLALWNLDSLALITISTIVIFILLLKLFLYLFKLLENKWILEYRWEMIRVFLVFAITGTTSTFVSKPILNLIGITKENLNPLFYWLVYIIIGLIFYQILLVFFGWLFGQGRFFWNFEKKILKRLGIKFSQNN